MLNKKRGELKKEVFIFASMLILILFISTVSAERLPTVGGDTDNWGTILNNYLSKLAGANATTLNETMVNGTNIYSSAINTTHLLDGTITDADISDTTNLTLGEKITFALGGIIDNIANEWIRITGGLNVTGNIETSNNITANYFIGDGSLLTNIGSSSDTIWNITGSNYLVNNSGILEVNETALNTTIDNKILINSTNRNYIYDESKKIYFNETKLNETINALENDTLYYAGGIYIYKNGSDYFIFNETVLNSSIDSRVSEDYLNLSGTNANQDINISPYNFEAGNLTLADKITFTLGEIIDNIIDGWITITGSLNVTENINVVGNATADWATLNNLNVTGTSYLGSMNLAGGNITATIGEFATLNITGTSYLGDATINADNITINGIVSKNGNISFYNDAGRENVRINEGGNVGIGTITPGTTLQINGNVTIGSAVNFPAQLEIQDIFSAGGKNLVIGDDTFLSDIDLSNIVGLYGIADSTKGGIQLGNNTNATIFGSSGNIGIGTTTPSARLEVNGNMAFTGSGKILSLSGDSNTQEGSINGLESLVGMNDLKLFGNTSTIAGIIIQSNGNVGIGKTPAYQLELSTDSAAKPSTNTWTIASDKRIKKDIKQFSDGLDVILGINPVTYGYNGLGGLGYEDDGQTHIGIIAQDLEKVAPYMVETREGEIGGKIVKDFKTYQGHALAFVTVNAIQEQQSQIEELKSENYLLKSELCLKNPTYSWC